MILSGPSQSTSIQIINGAQSASLTYSFIGSGQICRKFYDWIGEHCAGGNTYETKPIKITVVKGTDKPQQQKNDSQVS